MNQQTTSFGGEMAAGAPTIVPDFAPSPAMPSTRANVSVLYWLHLAGFVTGITPLIALVMAYMGRGQDGDAVADSHYTYVIRTFWIGTLYAAIALVSMAVLIGFVLLPVAAIWWIVRSAKGLSCAGRGQPIPKPTTWLW